MKPFILASQSPRRKQLLEQVQLSFTAVPSRVEEILPDDTSPDVIAATLASQKASDVFNRYPASIVLGADTIVAADGTVFGKPLNKQDAFRMLRFLSGRMHTVMTAVTIMSPQKEITFVDETDVHFYELADSEINNYISTDEPFDKAGAYGIQGLGSVLVKKIEGDYFTIVGLPVARVVRALKQFI